MPIELLVILILNQQQVLKVQQVQLISRQVVLMEAVPMLTLVVFQFVRVVLPTDMVATLNLKLVLEMAQQ